MFNCRIINYGCAIKTIRLLIRSKQCTNKRDAVASNRVDVRKASYISSDSNTIQTVGDFLSTWEKTFRKLNVSEPNESITHILAHVLKTKRSLEIPTNIKTAQTPTAEQILEPGPSTSKEYLRNTPKPHTNKDLDEENNPSSDIIAYKSSTNTEFTRGIDESQDCCNIINFKQDLHDPSSWPKVHDVLKSKNRKLTDDEIQKINKLCRKRLERMPLQYIIEEWNFRQLTLKLRPPTFIPRPETEQLVELVVNDLSVAKSNTVKILEPCCGSGAIILSLLHELKNISCVAFDNCKSACNLTQENAINLNLISNLTLYNLDVKDAMFVNDEKFDVIVSNPPYIPSDEILDLQPEILNYENHTALDGGKTGLNIIKQIFMLGSQVLKSQGKIFLEVDPSHPALIKRFLSENVDLGLCFLGSHTDFNGLERFVKVIKN